MLKVKRTLDAYLLSSVNVNLTKSFCILSTNELLKRRQGNNNNKRLKSKSKSKYEGKERTEEASKKESTESELFVARAGNCTSYQLNN